MKLAISGKGGVGKTTVAALLSAALRSAGHDVIAIDADPDANLLAAMGYPARDSVSPLVELKDIIEERTGVKPGTVGGMFKLNPRVDDLPEKYAVDVEGVKVLVAGAVKKGGSGCYCPENSLVRTLIAHVLLDEDTSLVLDMEAGVEHLSRGTTQAVDALIVVVEPGRRSIETAERILRLAGDLGLRQVVAVGNKVRSAEDEELIQSGIGDIPLAVFVPYDHAIRDAEIGERSVVGASHTAGVAVAKLVDILENQSLAEKH